MRLLEALPDGRFRLTEDLPDHAVPPYAILSHRWENDDQEVTYGDIVKGQGRDKAGYDKIQFCGEQATRDGLQYFWVDSCCINKSSEGEHQKAIQSMFHWYRRASRCYVYLSDVSVFPGDNNDMQQWGPDFQNSKWFTRGWTLQELLAPASVEFFSRNRARLGDKGSLLQQIQQKTGIDVRALQGERLTRFSINERFSWMERRKTTVEEDKAYSLLGIFDVSIPIRNGEGMANAFKRLEDEINKRSKCIQDLRVTDPRDDKKRIEDTKGGLLADSYHWILENSDFQRWRGNQQSHMLWIKGDPGKGKTMLLCGIINQLRSSMPKSHLLSYFFCQATDSRINNAVAVLRGLLFLLVDQQPSLVSHIRKKHDQAGEDLFKDANAWVALSEIFTDVLQDPYLEPTYLIIDALDECTVDWKKLLRFIAAGSSLSPRVKWLVSSRNWPPIEERLDKAESKVRLCLELNSESISAAVKIYIEHKVCQLTQEKKYDDKTRDAVIEHMSSNANDTFLWVALVCQSLESVPRWNVRAKLKTFPPGLDSLYQRMMGQISDSESPPLCKRILALIAIVYEPITMFELTSLIDTLEDMSEDPESLQEIIGLCGSFLTIRKDTIYFVHQSAKDYLLLKASVEIFPSGKGESHYTIFSRSLEVMYRTLHRDMYGFGDPGYAIERVKQPDPDPLSALRYSCIYWVDHLYECEAHSLVDHQIDLQMFVREKFLHWLEALSLLKAMSNGVLAMAKLEKLVQDRADAPALLELIHDARRFLMYHKQGIEISPLQAYTAALIFSPTNSLIRRHFKKEEPKWIAIKPGTGERWSACLQTLEGHSDFVNSVAFSPDSARLASASGDCTVKIWDTSSGACLDTLEGHSGPVKSVAFSPDSARLASASWDCTVKIWDTSSGACLETLEGHSKGVNSVAFSPDSARLASASRDYTVKIWDTSSGACLETLEGHSKGVNSVAFSPNSARLASALGDHTVKIWDTSSGACLETLEGHSETVNSVAFSPDSTRLASASWDHTVKIWDISSGACLETLEGHSETVNSVAFSPDSTRLASASWDCTVKIWDISSGACLETLEGHGSFVISVAFSPDSTQLASASEDYTVKIWDIGSGAYLDTLEGHSGPVKSIAFSPDSTRLASASWDCTVKIWDVRSGACLETLEGHNGSIDSVAFSPDSTRLASASGDCTVKIWDIRSGAYLETLEGHSDFVKSVAFSPDSTRLASASWDCTVKIWDTSSGACLETLEGHSDFVNSVAFSPDSARLASASRDYTVKIWDTSSGACLETLEGHSGPVKSVAFSPDSARLASASGDHTAKIWDTSSGACLETLEGHSKGVNSVAFSPDSARLASASWDHTVKIWDISSGACLQTLSIGTVLDNISFDITGSSLYTDIGIIVVDTSAASSITPDKMEHQNPRYEGVSLGPNRDWIRRDSKNIIWLPSDYRPSCSAVSGRTIGIGAGSGMVWMCNLERTGFEHC
ncbi:uncharacterized protein PV07_10547 [Cladophialophora immunda]|uniref:WD40 repeat-containing protein SMU1 n=1 Tax=Cladophialophora immunda TaxID=569365 RepID=A0A0D2C303_9EURO|nr:uncharacterized protein PV07_10547 [Cladophialophora immunda]KIW24860.1 hypothetical protein PV07_10547 [Cladophialophora immunda]